MSTPPLPFARRHRTAIIVLAGAVVVIVLAAAITLATVGRRPDTSATGKPAKAHWSAVSQECPTLSDGVAKSLGLKTDALPSSQVRQPENPVADGYAAAGMRTCQWLGATAAGWLVATVYVFDHDPDRGNANDVARDFVTAQTSLHPVDCTAPTVTGCWRGAVVQTEFAATSDNAVIGLHGSDNPRPTDNSLADVSSELLSMMVQ